MTESEIVQYEYTPAVIEADFDAMQARLDSLLADFSGLTPESVDALDTKMAKAWRAELNSMAKQLNDARIAVKREYEKPYEAFKAKVDALIEQIKGPQKLLDDCIKARESKEKEERRLKLEATYEEFAPALVEVVPFERILDPRWLNKSYGEAKAENALTEKVAKIAKDRDALIRSQLRVPEETMAEFYRTLDVPTALSYDEERAKELERIAAMNAEIEANRADRTLEAEPISYAEAETDSGDSMTIDDVRNTVPISDDESIYRFTIEVPRTEFATTINEATALKNHIAAILGYLPKMTKSAEPIKVVR